MHLDENTHNEIAILDVQNCLYIRVWVLDCKTTFVGIVSIRSNHRILNNWLCLFLLNNFLIFHHNQDKSIKMFSKIKLSLKSEIGFILLRNVFTELGYSCSQKSSF